MDAQLMSDKRAAVSHYLEDYGWEISPVTRRWRYPGIFVGERLGFVTVLVDLGESERNEHTAEMILADISEWDRVRNPAVVYSRRGTHSATYVRFLYGSE